MIARGIVTNVMIGLMVFSVSCQAKLNFKDKGIKQGYAVGQSIGINLKQQGVDIGLNYDALVKGLEDALADKSELSKEVVQSTLLEFQKEQIQKQQMKISEESNKNKEAAAKFLKKNQSKKGIKTTKSGLQYKVNKRGKSKKSPKPTDTVSVHYKGTLLDGTEFDSSYKRNQPAEFPVNGVIKGWTEALQLMNVGDEYTLYISPELGYGERGAGPLIGPNSLLIFEVKLLEIK